MNDESAFLKAITEAHDDVARLAYADWLEERGDPRAAWVRDDQVFAWMLPDGRDPLEAMLAAATGDDYQRRHRASEAMRRFGAAAVPALIDRIAAGTTAEWAGEVIGGMKAEDVAPFVPRLLALAADERFEVLLPAVIALRAAGPAAAPALPTLLRLLPEDDEDDLDDAHSAAPVLAAIGPTALPAVPALTRCLCHADDDEDFIRAIVAVGPEAVGAALDTVSRHPADGYTTVAVPLRQLADRALPTLRAALRHDSPRIRRVAALALVGHDPVATMPELVAGLTEAPGISWTNDSRFVEAIREASAFVRPPISELQRVLLDVSDGPRNSLAECLDTLGAGDGVLALLRGRLEDPEPGRRGGAISTLRNLSNVPEEAVLAVEGRLADANENVREEAKRFLSGLTGERRTALIPRLAAHATGQVPDTSLWAIDELAKDPTPAAHDTLRRLLGSDRPEVRERALNHLRGADPRDAPTFLRLTADPSPAVRRAAVGALSEAGPFTAAHAEAIRAALGDSDPAVRVAGLRAATVRDPAGFASAARLLAEADDSAEVRQAAVDLIPGAGLPPADAVATLRAALADPVGEVRAAAAFRLADVTATDPAAAAPAVPDLLPLLSGEHDHSAPREGAGWALHRIGAAALPGLVAALASQDEAERRQAAFTLVNSHAIAGAFIPERLAALASPDEVVRERVAWGFALSAPPGTDPTPFRRLLRGQNADTTEYAITALARMGARAAWPEIARLIDHETDDVAGCVVWAAGLLRPEQARDLWRGWLASPREAVRRAAKLELFLSGAGDPLTVEELFGSIPVLATRDQVTRLLAERAATNDDDFQLVWSATTDGSHHRHGTAVRVLGRVGRPEAAERVGEAMSRLGCTQREGLQSLAEIGPPLTGRARAALRRACESGSHDVRGQALSLMRRVLAEGNPTDA